MSGTLVSRTINVKRISMDRLKQPESSAVMNDASGPGVPKTTAVRLDAGRPLPPAVLDGNTRS
jgi:hypothetical protein